MNQEYQQVIGLFVVSFVMILVAMFFLNRVGYIEPKEKKNK